MNTSILVILILLMIIIGANLCCSCSQYPIFVTLGNLFSSDTIKEGNTNGNAALSAGVKKPSSDPGAAGTDEAAVTAVQDVSMIDSLLNAIPKEVQLASQSNPGANVSGFTSREGFISEGASTLGAPLQELNNGDLASSWISKATTFASEFGYGDMNNKGTAYNGTPVPLPEGEMVIFSQNKFKPECCPSPYSSSSGCACITPEQINYLNTRGGNRSCGCGSGSSASVSM